MFQQNYCSNNEFFCCQQYFSLNHPIQKKNHQILRYLILFVFSYSKFNKMDVDIFLLLNLTTLSWSILNMVVTSFVDVVVRAKPLKMASVF